MNPSKHRVPARADEESGVRKLAFGILIALLIFNHVRPQSFLPFIGLLRPGLLFGSFLILFSLANLNDRVYRDFGIRMAIGFLLFSATSVLWAVNTYWVAQISTTLLLNIFAAIIPICLLVTDEARLRTLIKIWIAVHVYLAAYCISHGGRGPGSFIEDENDVALALNSVIPFAYFLRNTDLFGKKTYFLLTIFLTFMVAGVVATNSRGGFVGLLAVAAVIILTSRKVIRNALLVGSGAVILLLFASSSYMEEMSSINDTEDTTRQERIYSWMRGLDMAFDNPVVGVGVGNYPWRIAEYQIRSDDRDYTGPLLGGRAAHSLFVTLLAETGLVGTVLFGTMLASLWSKLRRIGNKISTLKGPEAEFLDNLNRSVLASIVGFLVTGVFISVLYYPHIWYAVAFAFVVSTFSRDLLSRSQRTS